MGMGQMPPNSGAPSSMHGGPMPQGPMPQGPMSQGQGPMSQGPWNIPSPPNQSGTYGQPTGQPQQPFGSYMDRAQGMWSNTMDSMHQWTNKMTAMVGHTTPPGQQPPTPQMEFNGASGNSKLPPALRTILQMRRNRQKVQGKRRVLRTMGIVMLSLVILTTIGSSTYAYIYYQQQLPKVQQYANKFMPQDTRIYDRNGNLLYEVYQDNSPDPAQNGRRIPVDYSDIPVVMQNAQIAIEDDTFWTNPGVNFDGLFRAVSSAGGSGGGSSITQQLIKNLSGDDQYSVWRKIPEAAEAIGMTNEYPKTTILTMYMNTVPYGASELGVEAAVETYFQLQPKCNANFECTPALKDLDYNTKTKKDDPVLGLARASLLAGIVNAPSYYDPTLSATNKQNALNRQKVVLNAMISQHMKMDNGQVVTPAIAAQAEQDMANTTFTPYQGVKKAPDFVDWTIAQLENSLGNGDPQLGATRFITGGYNIRTTIDVNLEDYVEAAVQRHLYKPEYQMYPADAAGVKTLSTDLNVNSAAVVVLNNQNGEILAMDGSGNYYSTNPEVGGSYNIAAPPGQYTPPSKTNPNPPGRPPGSTFKPIVYATAMQMGWDPNTVEHDTETFFPNGMPAGTAVPTTTAERENGQTNGLYVPSDYGNTYHTDATLDVYGEPSLLYATENSLNIPALKAMQYAGQQNVLLTAERMGVTTIAPTGISWAIGSENVPLIEMAQAYQTLADSGQHIPPQGILAIYDSYGNELYSYNPGNPPATQVLSPQVSYMMTSILTDQQARYLDFGDDTALSFAQVESSCANIAGLVPGASAGCDYPIAAKTGTSDDFKDNLTIGYTPDVTVAVWAGNANDEAMGYNTIGLTGAAPIFQSVMSRAMGFCEESYDSVPCGPAPNLGFKGGGTWTFPQPGGLTTGYANSDNGLAPATGVSNLPDTNWELDSQVPTVSGIPTTGMPTNVEVEPITGD
jgi:membrane peptidoglycan carboxypeptidase